MSRLFLLRLLPAVTASVFLTAPATAATIGASVEPLGLLSSAPRVDCNSATAPYPPSDTGNKGDRTKKASRAQFANAGVGFIYGVDEPESTAFLPMARICSPTFGAMPEPFSGSIADGARAVSRLGTGWREIGGTVNAPAYLTPGQRFTVPAVDDAATLRLWLAPSAGQPTSVVSLADLAPGPSEVAISSGAQGLVATLTRADGSVASATAAVTKLPPLEARISGNGSRWTLKSKHLPKSSVLAFVEDPDLFGFEGTETESGDATVEIAFYGGRPKRGSSSLRIVSLNSDAQLAQVYDCRVTVAKRGRPRAIRCGAGAFEEIASLFGAHGLSSQARGARLDAALRQLRAKIAAAQRAHGPVDAVDAADPVVADRTRVAAAPLTAVVTPQSVRTRGLKLSGLKPLAADVNGDGGIDYWTEDSGDFESGPRSSAAGYVVTSSPVGLTAHRVEIPLVFADSSVNSDISAIDDITGDGIGELVVDLDERHAFIPGNRAWTGSTSVIRTPDLTDLQSGDRVARLQLSSPGSPFATLDDANGDGVRELAAADDSLGWFAVSGAAIAPGRITALPSAVPAPTVPRQIVGLPFAAETGLPQVPAGTRVIAGQAVALRWPREATAESPVGAVAVDVRDGRGTSVRPGIQVSTPGNAVLLDYDRPSGDLLLLAAGAGCDADDYRPFKRRGCVTTLLRVGPDGNVRQRVTVRGKTSALALGTARFLPDGPDADASPDVAVSHGAGSVALLESGRLGKVSPRSLSRRSLYGWPRGEAQDRPPLRLFPVLGSGGSRRLVVLLPRVTVERYDGERWRDVDNSARPAELRWR